MNCSDCKHVRKACNKDMVACGFLSSVKHGYTEVPLVQIDTPYGGTRTVFDMDFNTFFDNYVYFKKEHEVYSGWADLRSKPNSDSSGIISNDCIIVSPDNKCDYWRKD